MCAAAPAAAQQTKTPVLRPVGLEGVPNGIKQATATLTGDLLVVPLDRARLKGQPMTRLMSSSEAFQIEPVNFSEPSWATLKMDDVSQHKDGTLWTVGQDLVLYRPLGKPWAEVGIGALEEVACKRWVQFGAACQMVVPLAQKRAIVLRPKYERVGSRRMLSTEVIAVEQGSRAPLGRVVLPGIALGPSVRDGLGGFWVMVRRMKQSGVSPMRGYLHYTSEGQWLMWSDSEEAVEGTTLMGQAAFVVDPEPRKMAPDGKGGFYAIGKDDIIYHVDVDGKASTFSADQPRCQYCRILSLSYDELSDEVIVLSSKWRVLSNGQREFVEGLKWLRFSAGGALQWTETVPMPKKVNAENLALYDTVTVHAAKKNTWVLAPGLALHRDELSWSWLATGDDVQEILVAQRKQELRDNADSGLYAVGVYGGMGTAAATLVGSVVVLNANFPDVEGSQKVGAVGSAYLMSLLVGSYTSTLFYRSLAAPDPEVTESSRSARFLSGGLLTPLLIGGTNWYMMTALLGAETNNLGTLWWSLGGAGVGTAASLFFARTIYDNSIADEPPHLFVTLLGTSIVSGFSSLGYALGSGRRNRGASTSAGNEQLDTTSPLRGPMLQMSFVW